MNWDNNTEEDDSSSGEYSVKWKEYQDNLTYRISQFLRLGKLTDVTIACEGETKRAHKLLLALASPYFKKIFELHSNNNFGDTIVILNHVRFRDLKNILTFVYSGHVNVSGDDLEAFLQAAELLQIDGLTASKDDEHSSNEKNEESHSTRSRKTSIESIEMSEEGKPLSNSTPEGEVVETIEVEGVIEGGEDVDEERSDIERGSRDVESCSHGDYDFSSFPEVQIEPLIEVVNLEEDGVMDDNDEDNDHDSEKQSIQTRQNDADDEDDGDHDNGNDVDKDDDENVVAVVNDVEDKNSDGIFYNMVQKAVANTTTTAAATTTTSMKRRRRHSSAFQILAMDDYDFTHSSKPHGTSITKMNKKTTTTIMKKKNEGTGGVNDGIVSNGTHEFDGNVYPGSSSTASAVVSKVQRKLLSRPRKPRKKNNKNNKKALAFNKPRLPCSICFRTFKNKNVLYNHRSVYHRKGR